MNYYEIDMKIGKSKFAKTCGIISIIIGILLFIITIANYINWQLIEKNYHQQYVYSDYGQLYYEENNQRINVLRAYDTDNAPIDLKIPNKKTIIMYCSKDKKEQCLYLNMNSTTDISKLNPIMNIFSSLFLISMGMFFANKRKIETDNTKEKNIPITSIYPFFVFILLVGISIILWQSVIAVKYFEIKKGNNIAKATIYSEIYNVGGNAERYKPVAYYYIDNQKYTYISDLYIEGTLEDNIGKEFDIYYDINNPEITIEKESPINILFIIFGIMFTVFTIKPVLFKKKVEEKLTKTILNNETQEWKI